MKKILVIRLSAMGDIVHAFPALSDIRRRWPDAQIDVATDSRFADLVEQHRDVDRVIALPIKSWKKGKINKDFCREFSAKIQQLREMRYDAILDLHGVIKSAAVAVLARAHQRMGPEWMHCAEKLAWLAYGQHLESDENVAPVVRMRLFAAQALDTDAGSPVDFGLGGVAERGSLRRIALVHASSCDEKLWPEAHWIALGQRLRSQGFELVLPWGSPAELERAKRIAAATGAELGAAQKISDWLTDYGQIALLIGVDTGLTHLAAAAGVPCLALFTTTDPALFVPQNPQQSRTLGGMGHVPPLADVCHFTDFLLGLIQQEPLPSRFILRAPPAKVRRKLHPAWRSHHSHGV